MVFSLLFQELGAPVIKIKVHIHVAYHHIRHNFTTYKRLHMLFSKKVRDKKTKKKKQRERKRDNKERHPRVV